MYLPFRASNKKALLFKHIKSTPRYRPSNCGANSQLKITLTDFNLIFLVILASL